MAIDMAKIKARLSKHQTKSAGGGGKSDFFELPLDTPKTIRVLCGADGDPFKDYRIHWDFKKQTGGRPFMDLHYNFGKHDPIYNACQEMWAEFNKDKTQVHVKDLAKALTPSEQYYCWVIERGAEDEGPKLWNFSKNVYGDILMLMTDPDYGDISDPVEGNDLKVLKYKGDNGWNAIKMTARPRKTAIFDDDPSGSRALEIMRNLPEVSSKLNKISVEEQGRILDAFLSQGIPAEEVSSETTKYSSAPTTTQVDKAFSNFLSA
jgi:hypothetical protein